MLTQSVGSLLSLSGQRKMIPIVENRPQFVHALDSLEVKTIFLRHCNLFEFGVLLEHAYRCKRALYVNVDNIGGIHPDAAGLRYLAHHLHVTGILSSNPKTLALAKNFDLETIQRLFAVDSTGLEAALDSVDTRSVDLLDISPAPVVPYVIPYLKTPLPLPFTASGLIFTFKQAQAVIEAGASAVAVAKSELWSKERLPT